MTLYLPEHRRTTAAEMAPVRERPARVWPRGLVATAIAAVQGDQPPHWGVTFAVDDADAIAARATELGGQVVVPPFDAPWVRMTIITDPQGATFTASKFVPENKELAA